MALAPLTFAWPAFAQAQPTAYPISIAPKAYSEALIDLALQTNISLLGADQCPGQAKALSGRFTVRAALTRLFTQAPCWFEIVDSKTVQIFAVALPAKPIVVPRSPRPPAILPPPELPTADSMAEVVVTATKRSAPLGATAAAVSLISGTALSQNGTRHTSGISGQIAGVVITNLGPGRDKILLRGLSDGAFTGRTRSTVGTYLDDVPITYNAPDPDLRLTDVERIEVVRGPQGALYGGGSLSGVFRIVTKRPDLNRRSAAIDVAGARTDSGSPSTSYDLMGNLPIVPGKAAVRVVGYSAVDGGFVDDVNLRLSNVDRTLRYGGRIATEVRAADRWTITGNAAFQRLESNDTQYTTMTRLQRANRIREAHKNNFSEVGVTVIHTGEWAKVQSSTAYVRHDFSSLYDASAALSLFDSGEADLGVFREAAKNKLVVQDVFVTPRNPGRFDWLIGVYASHTAESTPSALRAAGGSPGLPPVPIYAEERTDRLYEGALYSEVSYHFGQRLTASLGARLFDSRLHVISGVVASPSGARNFDGSKTFKGVSPKVSLQYSLGPSELIYALASQGYRAGGFNTAGRSAPSPTRQIYGSDRLENYEVGAKVSPFGGKLNLRTALFYARWNDIQTDQYFSSGLSYTANVGDGRNIGLEGEVAFSPVPHLVLQANVMIDSPTVSHLNGNFATKVEPGLPGIPDVSFGAQAHYDHPLSDLTSLLLGAQLAYTGRSHLTFEANMPMNGASSEMGDILTAKLSAQYSTPRWRVDAFVTNPANTQGDTFSYGNPFSFGEVRQVTPQRPRTMTLELTATF